MRDRVADRRRVIAGGALLGGAGLLASTAIDAKTPAAAGVWQPAMEAQDAWLDKPGTRHRLLFDTTTPEAAESALSFADTFYDVNKRAYGIEPGALGVVIVLRHFSTPYGYGDAPWARFGAQLVDKLNLKAAQAVRALSGNPLLSAPPASAKPGKAPDDAPVTLATLAAKGARFAICGVATRKIAEMLAKDANGSADEIEATFKANLIPRAIIVPAGIVAVNRAQEHGYAFVNIPA